MEALQQIFREIDRDNENEVRFEARKVRLAALFGIDFGSISMDFAWILDVFRLETPGRAQRHDVGRVGELHGVLGHLHRRREERSFGSRSSDTRLSGMSFSRFSRFFH